MQTTQTLSNSPTHRGPHPGVLAVIHVILFMAGLLWLGIASQGKAFPNPFNSLQSAQTALFTYPGIIRISSFLQFGAAIPLGIFTAAVTSRLHFLGVKVTGVSIALFGGITASVFMIISALCGWVLIQPGVATDINIMHTVQLFGFVTGGVTYVATLGLLIAGISVPCLLGNYTPRWVALFGIILAVIAELSTFSLVFYPVTYLLPIVRFGSYIWMIATGFTLAKNDT